MSRINYDDFPMNSEDRPLYFTKEANGNVILYQKVAHNNPLMICSFAASQNVIKDISNPNKIKITDTLQPNQNGMVIDWRNIDGTACIPTMEDGDREKVLTGLSADFFFEVGNEIIEADTFSAFPSIGMKKKIYIAVDTLKQYRWNGLGYDLFNSGSTSNDNQILSGSEFRKTFFSDFAEGTNNTRNIVLPDVDIDGEFEIQIQSANLANGIITKVFTLKKTQYIDALDFNTSITKTVNSAGLLQYVCIGEAIALNHGHVYIPITKNAIGTDLSFKITVLFKTSQESISIETIRPLFNGIFISAAQTGGVFSRNYQTKKFLPTKSPINTNMLVIDPITKEIGEASPTYQSVRLAKQVYFDNYTGTMLGDGVTDSLTIKDFFSHGYYGIQASCLPANTLLICAYSNKLISFMGYSSTDGIIMDVYKGHLNPATDYLTGFTLLASIGLSTNLTNHSFGGLGLDANLDSASVIRLGFRDPDGDKSSKTIVEGVFLLL